jgi:5-methylcytosine-specific restriction protein B
MAEVTTRRIGELQRAVFTVLSDEPAGLAVQEVQGRAEQICPPTPFEEQDYPKQPGVRRYPRLIRFSTITSVKAGWLVKEGGVWRLTESGLDALSTYADPEAFQRAAVAAYKSWKADQQSNVIYTAEEVAEDTEAARLEAGQTQPRRAWLVRGANVSGVNVLPRWFDDGYCSIDWNEIPEFKPGTPKIEIAKLVKAALPDAHIVSQGLSVGVLDRFVNEMRIGDLVVTVDGPKVYVGVIDGEATHTGEPLVTRQRTVAWSNLTRPFLRSQLSQEAADGLRGQLTLSDLTPQMSEFAHLGGVEIDPVIELTLPEASIAGPDQQLADRLLLPWEWLRETVDLLNDKRQIVLYGPPGTGKTYLAQELCKALVEGSGGEYEVVQFHPSYAYEDFFEGIRPRLQQDGSGGVAFDLVWGPLRRLADRATQNQAVPYALIIDEINRANLAKVFGELYFLLEYRATSVSLQYSDDKFYLPRNLFFIGTMNTADRSIALVDAAMRRRFYFQGLFPGADPIKDVLPRWLEVQGLPGEAAQLLRALNETINDEDFAIGPSYLMTKRVAESGGLERIWKTAIIPLLAEHYFGEGRDIEAEFGLPGLRKRLNGPTPVATKPHPAAHDAGDAGPK